MTKPVVSIYISYEKSNILQDISRHVQYYVTNYKLLNATYKICNRLLKILNYAIKMCSRNIQDINRRVQCYVNKLQITKMTQNKTCSRLLNILSYAIKCVAGNILLHFTGCKQNMCSTMLINYKLQSKYTKLYY